MKETGKAIEKYQPLWGSWKVEKLISQGRGIEIYRASKEEWGKKYVSTVKLMSFSVGTNDIKEAQVIGIGKAEMPEYFKSLVNNIQNEIELMYRLRGNSNIVTYEDHGIYEKKNGLGWDVLIRMEFLKPLPDFIVGQNLTRLEVARLGIDICKALEVCGREGIIHRDIRDSSIFVSPKGEYKLGSFGMAKELLKGGRTPLTSSNPLYMAPELYKEQGYDSTIDTYSLGIVMYKLLNRGRLPFLPMIPDAITIEDTERSIALRMAGEKLPMPEDAGEGLGSIILKACSFDKRDRYKTPLEFRKKLERFLKAEEKSSGSDSVKTREMFIYTAANSETAPAGTAQEQKTLEEESAIKSVRAAMTEAAAASVGDREKLVIAVSLCAVLMILAFLLGYSMNFETQDSKEPVAEKIEEEPQEAADVAPLPAAASTTAPEPEQEKSGEEYYQEGLKHMNSNRNESAIASFQQAKKLGYDSKKADTQISIARKRMEVQSLRKKAMGYYEQQDYVKAVEAFEALARADASYGRSSQYADAYFKIAEKHNEVGMRYFSEGKLEDSSKEFDKALSVLEKMKENLQEYDSVRYNKWHNIYKENKKRMHEKINKIDEYMKLADECNRTGVQYFNNGSYKEAKLEFERALKHLAEVRLIAPQYASNGYEGLIKIYKENLRRANINI